MEKNEQMIIVYNMGNFHNGKTAQTHDKEIVHSYELAGYKLISCVMMNIMQYLKGKK
jgi:hypothetical protein